MTVSCIESLEASAVHRDNIYVVECPTDMLLPVVCRTIAKSGKFQAVIGLAVLPASNMVAQAMHTAFALQDFGGTVIPALVHADDGAFLIARASEEAARHAIEVSNLPLTLERLTDTELGELDIKQARMHTSSKRATTPTKQKGTTPRRLRRIDSSPVKSNPSPDASHQEATGDNPDSSSTSAGGPEPGNKKDEDQ